jgi:hypothetical protein
LKGFHLQVHFCFAEAVWDKIAQTFQVHPAIFLFQKGKFGGWMEACSRAGNKQTTRKIYRHRLLLLVAHIWSLNKRRAPSSTLWNISKRQSPTSVGPSRSSRGFRLLPVVCCILLSWVRVSHSCVLDCICFSYLNKCHRSCRVFKKIKNDCPAYGSYEEWFNPVTCVCVF